MIKLNYKRFLENEVAINVTAGLKTTGFQQGTREMQKFKHETQEVSDVKLQFDVSNMLSGIDKTITGLDKLKTILDSVDVGKGFSKISKYMDEGTRVKRSGKSTIGYPLHGEVAKREPFKAITRAEQESVINVLSSGSRGKLGLDANYSSTSGLSDTTAIEENVSEHKKLLETLHASISPLRDYNEVMEEIKAEAEQMTQVKKWAVSNGTNGEGTYYPAGTAHDISPTGITQQGSLTTVPQAPMFSQLSLDFVNKSDISAIEEYKNKLEELRKEAEELGNKSLRDLYNGVKDSGDEAEKSEGKFKKLIDTLNKMPNGIDGITKAFKNLDFSKLVYLAHTVKRVTSVLVDMVESAADYEESLNLYRMALGKYVDEARAWEQTISTKLMLDPADVMKYTGAFYNLTKGLNVTEDAAYLMSKNLTQLTYDMASYLNISNDAAQAKIQSAMAGQSRAVATVGVATQLASLQELAYSLNIKKKVSEMTQAEKTYLRYIQLMRSTTHMQGDLGRTMITPANAIRTLKNQIELLGRAIGQVLTPIIMKVIPYIMAFTNVLRKAAEALAGFFGYKLSDVDWDSTFSFEGADAAVDALDSVGGAAKGAADSVRNALAPFDELNQVMFESSGSGGGSGGGSSVSLSGDDFSSLLPSYDMLKDYTGELADKAKSLEGVVTGLVYALGGLAIVTKVADWFNKGIDFLGKFGIEGKEAAGIIGKLAGNIIGIGSAIAIGIGSFDLIKTAMYNNTVTGGALNDKLGDMFIKIGAVQGACVGLLAFINPVAAGIAALTFIVGDAVAGWDAFVDGIHDLADSNLFGTLSVSYSEWYDLLTNSSDGLNKMKQAFDDYDVSVKASAKSFVESSNALDVFNIKLSATGKLSKDELTSMYDNMLNMAKQTSSIIESKTSKDLLVWENTFKGMSGLTEEEQNNIKNSIVTRGKEQSDEVNKITARVTELKKKQVQDGKTLNAEEEQELKDHMARLKEITEGSLQENQATIEFYKENYLDKNKKLDKKSYEEFNKALKEYDKEKTDEISRTYAEGLRLLKETYGKDYAENENYIAAKKALDEQRETDMNDHNKEIQGYLGTMYNDFIQTYDDIQDETDVMSKGTRDELSAILVDIPLDRTQFVELLKAAGVEGAEQLADKVYNTAKSPEVKKSMGLAAGAVKDFFSGGWHANVGPLSGDMFTDLKAGLDKASKNNSTKDGFKSVGNFVLTAIFNGLMSFAGLPGQFASKLLKEVKKALGIQSPSRLFMRAKVGDYITMGIEEGMMSEIHNGIPDVANGLLNTMQDTLDESNDITFGDKLTTGIEEVTEGFKGMNEEILEFNKNANNIAITSNVATNRKITSDYNDIMGLVSGAYATDGNNTTNLVDTVREASSTNNTIVVQIGDETVYQGQGQYQSRESDRYGTTYVKI